jgi:hypothetical protein
MRLILFIILLNTVSAFSQILSFKADTLFMDNSVYIIEENDDVRYELNLYDSTLLTINNSYRSLDKISYKIESGSIYIKNIAVFEILKDNRLKLIFLNRRGEEDLYFLGNLKLNY